MADHPGPLEAELTEARDLCLLPDAEQLELIRDAVPGRDAATAVAVATRRGRGRPPGSLNKRNAKFRDQILALAPHPALALARAYSTPVDQLAASLGCSLYEAAKLGIMAAAEVLPYVESKMPTAVHVRSQHDAVIVMTGAAGALDGGELEAIQGAIADASEDGPIDWSSLDADETASLLGGHSATVTSEGGE